MVYERREKGEGRREKGGERREDWVYGYGERGEVERRKRSGSGRKKE